MSCSCNEFEDGEIDCHDAPSGESEVEGELDVGGGVVRRIGGALSVQNGKEGLVVYMHYWFLGREDTSSKEILRDNVHLHDLGDRIESFEWKKMSKESSENTDKYQIEICRLSVVSHESPR